MAKNFDYSKIKYYKLYPFVRAIANVFVRLIFRIRYVGKENIPSSQGYILASNHISNLDPVVHAISMKSRVFYMSKAELFNNRFVAFFIRHFQGFPVNRSRGDLSAVEYAIKVVNEGNILGIFPEGTRSKTGKPLPPKAGIALIANKTGGFSGPAIKPVAVRMIYQVYEAVKIPIVGMGGVATAEDVIELMLAGATAVEVGAENLVNPYACRDIIEALPKAMEKYGIESLDNIIGAAH